jgi:hypothetical protein
MPTEAHPPSAAATAGDSDDQARAQIARTEKAEADSRAEEARVAKAARAFDLRRVIGGLFVVYGLILTVLGLFASDEDRAKAAGVNVNLWAGLAMLAAGLAFAAWALWRPLRPERSATETTEATEATDADAA